MAEFLSMEHLLSSNIGTTCSICIIRHGVVFIWHIITNYSTSVYVFFFIFTMIVPRKIQTAGQTRSHFNH